MKLFDFYLDEHAAVHSRAVALPESGVPIEDLVYKGLTDDMARRRPGSGLNSVAWLTWHMARCEDVAMNAIIAGQTQVLESQGWAERLHLDRQDIGTGMSDAEVGDLTSRVDISELRAYRAAVGRQTREVIRQLSPADLTQLANPERIARAFASGAVVKNGRWVQQFWDGKSVGFFLWLGTGHNFMHLGEANLIRTLVGAGPGV